MGKRYYFRVYDTEMKCICDWLIEYLKYHNSSLISDIVDSALTIFPIMEVIKSLKSLEDNGIIEIKNRACSLNEMYM